MEPQRPTIPDSEMNSPVGSDMPERKPLPLLPEREWLVAIIDDIKYQVAMFNNQVQYVTDKEDNPILDEDGNQIMRKEFEITFSFRDYTLSNGEPRKAWLRMGASMGEKAHLPVFLMNTIGPNVVIDTPAKIVSTLKGRTVKLQLANKMSKDRSKTYQNVVYDAVRNPNLAPPSAQVQPISPQQIAPTREPGEDDGPWDDEGSF